jgi:hypothetical protein
MKMRTTLNPVGLAVLDRVKKKKMIAILWKVGMNRFKCND